MTLRLATLVVDRLTRQDIETWVEFAFLAASTFHTGYCRRPPFWIFITRKSIGTPLCSSTHGLGRS